MDYTVQLDTIINLIKYKFIFLGLISALIIVIIFAKGWGKND